MKWDILQQTDTQPVPKTSIGCIPKTSEYNIALATGQYETPKKLFWTEIEPTTT